VERSAVSFFGSHADSSARTYRKRSDGFLAQIPSRPGGPPAKRQPSPEGLGWNPHHDPPAPPAPACRGALPWERRRRGTHLVLNHLRRRGTGDVSALSWDVLVSLPGSHTPSLTPEGTAFPGASRSGGLPLVNDTCIHMFLYQRFLCAKAARGIVGLHGFLRRIMRRYLTETTTRPDTRGDPQWRVSMHLPRTISVGPEHLTTHTTHITHHFRRPRGHLTTHTTHITHHFRRPRGHLTTHTTHITHHFRRPRGHLTTHTTHITHHFRRAQRAPYHAYHAPFPSAALGREDNSRSHRGLRRRIVETSDQAPLSWSGRGQPYRRCP
jgi:hypothetical protein